MRDFVKAVSAGMLVLFLVGMVVVCAGVMGVGCGAMKKANDEFGLDASLRKYETFKEMAAKLDAKKASIDVADARLAALDEQYKGVPRKEWPRADLEQSNLWRSEVVGMKASFNDLAARYNADMSKFNYSFANVGDLPKGADRPLPREFKPYETK